MRRHWRLVTMALRAAGWRATLDPPAIGLPGLVGWSIVVVAFLAVAQYAMTGGRFSEYGLGLLICWLMLSVTASALILRAENRTTALCAILLVAVIGVTASCVMLLLASLPEDTTQSALWTRTDTIIGAVVVLSIWLIGAYGAIVRSQTDDIYDARLRRAITVFAVQLAVLVAFPHFPAFLTHNNLPNSWDYVRSLLRESDDEDEPKRVDGARVELAQPALMEEAIDRLAPQVRGQTDVYAIGIAGFAEQDVFIKELDGALAAIGKVLPVRDRTIRLINHVDTVERTPVALRANFAAAVRAVARAMDRDEDILLLFMTSHGSPDGIALRLPGLIGTALAPSDVADVLDREGIKNRIVVVSACYSGVFVKPLANDNTIVLTAADEKSTSFGCSNEREWTYFGDALFNLNLRPDVSLEEAFLAAKVTIGQWEARDGLTPSNPQGHFGAALMTRLARVYGVGVQASETRRAP